MNELLESYLESSPRLLRGIDEALEAGDSTRLVAEAHGWKGISQTIGFEVLVALCWQLEETGRRGDLAEARAAVVSAHAAWQRIQPAIEKHLRGTVVYV